MFCSVSWLLLQNDILRNSLFRIDEIWPYFIGIVEKNHNSFKNNNRKYVHFQTEQGCKLGQPD